MKIVKDPCHFLTKKCKTVLYEDGTVEDFPLIKKTRDSVIKLIRKALQEKYEQMSKEELISILLEKVFDNELPKTKNDDLEALIDSLLGYGHVINEPCPFNGIRCSYGDINNLH